MDIKYLKIALESKSAAKALNPAKILKIICKKLSTSVRSMRILLE